MPPSGGTAITAGVLGILGAIWAIFAVVINLGGVAALDAGAQAQTSAFQAQLGGLQVSSVLVLQVVVFAIELLTLGPGSIMLLARQDAGRWLVAFGAGIHILQGLILFVIWLSYVGGSLTGVPTGVLLGGGTLGMLVALVPAVATLVLVLVPLTGRWCAWPRMRGMISPPPYG